MLEAETDRETHKEDKKSNLAERLLNAQSPLVGTRPSEFKPYALPLIRRFMLPKSVYDYEVYVPNSSGHNLKKASRILGSEFNPRFILPTYEAFVTYNRVYGYSTIVPDIVRTEKAMASMHA